MKLSLRIRQDKANKRGESVVQIAISHKQQTAYISTGIRVPYNSFHRDTLVCDSVPMHDTINANLNVLLNQYYTISYEFAKSAEKYDIRQIKAKLEEEWQRRYGTEPPKQKKVKKERKQATKTETPNTPIQPKETAVTPHIEGNFSHVRIPRNWDDWSIEGIIFLYLITKAEYQDRIVNGIRLNRGDVLTSVERIREDLTYSPIKQEENKKKEVFTTSRILRALNKKQTTNEIAIKASNKNSIITICNYDKYNGYFISQGQMKEQTNFPKNNNTNKNKNIIDKKEGRKSKDSEFIKGMQEHYPKLMAMKHPLTYTQYIDLCDKYGEDNVKFQIQAIENISYIRYDSAAFTIKFYLQQKKKK